MRIKKEKISILVLILLILYLYPQDFLGAFLHSYHFPLLLLKFHLYFGEFILFGLTILLVLKKIPSLIRKKIFTPMILMLVCFIIYYSISPHIFTFSAIKDFRSLLLPISGTLLGFSLLDNKTHLSTFTRFLIVFACALGVWGVYETIFIDNSFFYNHVNFARYLGDLKGYQADQAILGIDGTMWGREGFRHILPRRLSSVFGDPVGFPLGVSAVSIIYLHLFIRDRKYFFIGIYFIMMIAVVLTFTRSGYIFITTLSITYIVYSKLNKLVKTILFFFTLISIITVIIILKDFLMMMVEIIKNPGNNAHFLDLVGFYTTIIKDVDNLIGRGVGNGIWSESGLTILLSQTGIVGFSLFFLFIFYLFFYLNKGFKQFSSTFSLYEEVYVIIAMGIILSIPIIMHFYAYVFTLTTFYLNWLLIGGALRIISNKRRQLFLEKKLTAATASTINTSSFSNSLF